MLQIVGAQCRVWVVVSCAPKLESDLVVALACGAVADCISACQLSDLDLTLGNERPSNGGSQQVDALIQRVGPARHVIGFSAGTDGTASTMASNIHEDSYNSSPRAPKFVTLWSTPRCLILHISGEFHGDRLYCFVAFLVFPPHQDSHHLLDFSAKLVAALCRNIILQHPLPDRSSAQQLISKYH